MRSRLHTLHSDVMKVACAAVRDFGLLHEATEFIGASGLREQLRELATLNSNALTEAESNGRPSIAILNRPELIHLAMLIDDSECISSLISSTTSPTTLTFFPLSGIWKTYSSILAQFAVGSTPTPLPIPKCKGFESFFLPYIDFMMTQSDENMLAMANSYASRNSDKRYTDWVGLDGDGKNPVKWDLRAYTLEKGRTKRWT